MLISKSQYLTIFRGEKKYVEYLSTYFFVDKIFVIFGKVADQGPQTVLVLMNETTIILGQRVAPGVPLFRYLWKAALLHYDEKFDTTILRSKSEIVGTVQEFSAVAWGGAGPGGLGLPNKRARLIWSAETLFTLLFGSMCSFRFDKASKLFIFWLQLRKIAGN